MNLRDKLRDRPGDEPERQPEPLAAAEESPSPVSSLRDGMRGRTSEPEPAAEPSPEPRSSLRDGLRARVPVEPDASEPPAERPVRRARPVEAAPAEEEAPKKKLKLPEIKGLPQLDVNRRFLVLAGVAAGATALLGVWYLTSSAAGLREGGTKVPVVCAAQDLKAGVALTSDMTTIKEIPSAYVPQGYYQDEAKIDGRVIIAPMVSGEPILQVRLSKPDAKYGIAYLLKSGERAKAIKVDSASGLAGLIKPGNEVDLLATIPDPHDATRRIGTPVLQEARVIAVGDHLLGEVPSTDEQAHSQSGISADGTITLAIPETKIGLVSLLEDLGNLKMVLRAAGDDTKVTSQFSDQTIMALVSGKVPPKEAPKPVIHYVPRPQPTRIVHEVVHETYHPPVVHHAAPPKPKPQPPKPKPKPKPQPHTQPGVDVIQFGR